MGYSAARFAGYLILLDAVHVSADTSFSPDLLIGWNVRCTGRYWNECGFHVDTCYGSVHTSWFFFFKIRLN